MDWLIPFIVGWCGTVPIRWKFPPGGGGPGGGGDDPWPPNCPQCVAVLGGIAAVVLEIILRPQLGEMGLGTRMTFDFFAGMFAASALSGIGNMAFRKG